MSIQTVTLNCDMVILGARASDRFDAIRQAGSLLVAAGCAAPDYVDGMLAREQVQSTNLGCGIAVPHGEPADLRFVLHAGVSVLQIPEGVDWDPGERVYLLIGLASADASHAGVLSNLVELLQSPDQIPPLIHAKDPKIIVERLTRGRSEIVWN